MGSLDNIECACHAVNEDIDGDVVVGDGFDGGVD